MPKFKLSRLWYITLAAIWMLLGAHLFYNYIEFTSQKIPVKGGTLFEATLQKPTILPYLSFDPHDRYLQRILSRWCLKPKVEWVQINFEQDLCEVKTKDYQTFLLKAKPNNNRSDDAIISNKDLLFTYKQIIKQNIWQIPYLKNFEKIEVSYLTGTDQVQIKFPSSSIDNQILLSFPILPYHILEGTTLNE